MTTKKAALLIIIFGILFYLPSIPGGFVWDDEDFVYANTYVRDFRIDKFFTENVSAGRGKPSNYFRPVQLLVYSLTNLFFGFNPHVFHAVNVLFHVAATLAVYYFLTLIIKKPLIGLLTSLAFMIHPVQTEAVSYISGLSDPLYVLFGMMCLSLYIWGIKGIRGFNGTKTGKTNIVLYFSSIVFFGISLLSKESGIVFLLLLGIITVLFDSWKKIFLLLPHLVITVLYLIFHFSVINVLDMQYVWRNAPYSSSVFIRISTFLANLQTYTSLLIFPKDLFMERDFTVTVHSSLFTVWTLIFVIVNAALLAYILFIRRNNDKFLLLFCYLGFFISFAPISGIVLINGIFYEHFLYLPIIFFFGFWFIILEKYLKKKILVVIGIIGLIWIIRSIARQYEWADAVRLYEQTLIRAPGSVRVRNNLAMTLAERGQTERAIAEYEKAIELDPKIPNMYHNLGNIYRERGYWVNAEKYYRKAIEVAPDFSFSYMALLSMYQANGETAKFQEMLSLYEGKSDYLILK